MHNCQNCLKPLEFLFMKQIFILLFFGKFHSCYYSFFGNTTQSTTTFPLYATISASNNFSLAFEIRAKFKVAQSSKRDFGQNYSVDDFQILESSKAIKKDQKHSSMRTKDTNFDACRELCENHERGNLLMMSMELAENKRKKAIHFITISYHVSNLFAIFQFWGKFNENS